MKRFHFLIIILILFFFSIGAVVFPHDRTTSIPITTLLTSERDWDPSHIHTVQFFDEHLFLTGLETSPSEQNISGAIRGGIVPHHTLPSQLITRFFMALLAHTPQDTPQTVIILGPNHYEKGHYPVLLSEFAWKTPFGVVYPDKAKIEQLLSTTDFANVDETTVYGDHSVTAVIPYIKYFLPNARVMPIIISNKISDEDMQRLINNLHQFIDDKTIVIASVDFSHYLSAEEAAKNDLETYTMMKNRKYEQILELSNDHIDAPATIATFLQLMDKQHASDHVLLENTNSGALLNDPYTETTSYFSMVFMAE